MIPCSVGCGDLRGYVEAGRDQWRLVAVVVVGGSLLKLWLSRNLYPLLVAEVVLVSPCSDPVILRHTPLGTLVEIHLKRELSSLCWFFCCSGAVHLLWCR